MLNHGIIDILASQTGIAIDCFCDHIFACDFKDGDIESASTEVKYEAFFRLITGSSVVCVSQCCSGRLIDQHLAVEACDLCSVTSLLLLAIIEVGRYCDDTVVHRLIHFLLSTLLQFFKHLRTYLDRIQVLFWDIFHAFKLHHRPGILSLDDLEGPYFAVLLDLFVAKLQTEHPLCVIDRVVQVTILLSQGLVAYHDFASLRVRDH